MKICIRKGTIVTSKETYEADILIENGKITEIRKDLWVYAQIYTEINAKGCYVFPGGIDPHVHLHLPTPAGFSSDNFLSGSEAALRGGTTTLLDFVTPRPKQSLYDALIERREEAKECKTNLALHVSPIDFNEKTEQEISTLVENEGIKSFKVYMAYKDSIGLNDSDLFNVMKAVGKAGGLLLVHCELGDEIEALRSSFIAKNCTTPEYHPLSRPSEYEAEAVRKAIELAAKANCPLYIVHVSTAESLTYIGEAQQRGQKVYAETCPHYLLFDDAKYKGEFRETAPFVMSPPLRKKADNEALWKAMANNTVQTIGTDHCPFTMAQKEKGASDFRKIPNGAGGVEHRLELLYTYGVQTGKITINQFVNLTSTQAAKIFDLYPQKGEIAIGSDADLIVWNPEKEKIIASKNQTFDTNIYENMKIKGAVRNMILNGVIVDF